VLKSFAHKGLEALFVSGTTRGIQPKFAQKLLDILDLLDGATEVHDMEFPGSGLHALKGNRKGFWAIKVTGNWRIIFRFEAGDALDVNYLDYH
jgi:toxin HigB-1